MHHFEIMLPPRLTMPVSRPCESGTFFRRMPQWMVK